ncbi:hypothetical protein BU16DRAFT_534291 [Lophium mytilinum]|uniref:Uncharacterized protein n=1 Tax=Lophium mytilinum TaxID=390894 RepID=A0A6A6RB17_9PEZI|nr:hypothetical protein BU16DRAFT_534291 [Lophium mytilinum]
MGGNTLTIGGDDYRILQMKTTGNPDTIQYEKHMEHQFTRTNHLDEFHTDFNRRSDNLLNISASSLDGKMIAVGVGKGVILYQADVNPESFPMPYSTDSHPFDRVRNIIVAPTNDILLIIEENGDIWIWRIHPGRLERTFKILGPDWGIYNYLLNAAFFPDGNTILMAWQNKVDFWDLRNRSKAPLKLHSFEVFETSYAIETDVGIESIVPASPSFLGPIDTQFQFNMGSARLSLVSGQKRALLCSAHYPLERHPWVKLWDVRSCLERFARRDPMYFSHRRLDSHQLDLTVTKGTAFLGKYIWKQEDIQRNSKFVATRSLCCSLCAREFLELHANESSKLLIAANFNLATQIYSNSASGIVQVLELDEHGLSIKHDVVHHDPYPSFCSHLAVRYSAAENSINLAYSSSMDLFLCKIQGSEKKASVHFMPSSAPPPEEKLAFGRDGTTIETSTKTIIVSTMSSQRKQRRRVTLRDHWLYVNGRPTVWLPSDSMPKGGSVWAEDTFVFVNKGDNLDVWTFDMDAALRHQKACEAQYPSALRLDDIDYEVVSGEEQELKSCRECQAIGRGTKCFNEDPRDRPQSFP